MGTVTTTLAWPTGIDGTDLTSWAGDAVFSTTPVAGDVVAGSDTLTIAADGTVAGPDGNHTLTHLLADGSAQSLTYLIGADTTAPVLSSPTATQTGQATADASVSTDEDNGNLFWLTTDTATELAEDVISLGESQAVGSTGVQTVAVTGLTAGSPYYTHFVHRDAVGNNSTRVSSAQFTTASPVPVDVTASTTLVAPAGHFYVTTGTTPDYKIFSDNGWTAGEYPQPGEIFLWDNVDITFSEDLVPTGNTESSTVYCAVIRVDGAADGFTLDASQIPEVQITDTTPTQFTFTDLNNLPTGAERESNAITISGVDPATDIPASITGGEYAVSTDDGATFGAYTSAATNVQLDDQIKVRVTTSANNSTGTSAAFTAGGVTDTFTATTEAEVASVLESTDLESASNVSSSNISQTHVLESQSLNTDSASSNTQISQTHSLSTENVEAIPTLSLPSFGDMIYALNSSDVESGTNVNTPLLFILSQLNARVSESLSETSNPMISQTHSILTNNVEALSLNSIPFFTGEVAPLNMNGIPVKESVVFSASKMPTSLKQGSYYALKFPVLTNGEAVVSVEDAKFSLYRSGAEVLTKSIVDTSLNFASSTFNVDLDDSETEVLAGLYTFEMWFVDMSGNNIHVRSGNINFEPTKVRFI